MYPLDMNRLSLILGILLTLLNKGLTAQISIDIVIDNIIDKTFESSVRPCMTLISQEKIIPNGILFKEMPVVHIEPNITTLNSANFIRLFDGGVKCLISISGPDSLEKIIAMTKPVDNHVSLYLDDNKPPDELLVEIRRPLVWIDVKSQDVFEYNTFCPKVGQPKLPEMQKAGHCTKTCCDVQCFPQRLNVLCFNAFFGQTILMADAPTFPNFLMPQLGFNTGGKPISGGVYHMFMEAAAAYNFKPLTNFNVVGGDYLMEENTFTPGKYYSIINGESDVTGGALVPVFNMMDITFPFAPGNLVYLSRQLQPVISYGHITKPFPTAVWIATVITIFILATMQLVSYKVYQMTKISTHSLAKTEEFYLNFFLFSFVKLTEPDPLPWFQKWSTGKFLTFLWSLLSLFAIMFYTSNLRAHFMTVDYEDPPNTLNHIAERGKRVYIFDTAADQRKEFLEAIGEAGTPKHKIAILAEKTGGIFSFIDTGGGLPAGAPDDMQDNGAFILMEDQSIPYLYMIYPRMRRELMYIVDEVVHSYYKSLMVQKYSPSTKAWNKIIIKCTESGITNKWFLEHLPMSAVLKSRPPKSQLKALEMTSYYTSAIFYSVAMMIALTFFGIEVYKNKKPDKNDYQGKFRVMHVGLK